MTNPATVHGGKVGRLGVRDDAQRRRGRQWAPEHQETQMMKVRAWTGLFCGGVLLLMLITTASAQPVYETATPASGEPWRTVGLAFSAALTMAVSVLGAGFAVGRIGSAALGAAAEKPDLLTRSILFVALAEGLAVLGFAIAMMLTQKI